MQLIHTHHQLILFKLTHYLETTIFIIGGRFQRVHLYISFHHATLPVILWIGLNYFPAGGHSLFFMFTNLIAHSIMFGLLSLIAINPKLRKLNWKSVISWINVVQMVAIFLHGCQLFLSNSCNFPMILVWIASIWGISIMVAFLLTWPYLNEQRIMEASKLILDDDIKKIREIDRRVQGINFLNKK